MSVLDFINFDNLKDEVAIKKLHSSNAIVGMLEFNNKLEINDIQSKHIKIGNFELDIIALDTLTNGIVMIDHDSTNFVMGKVAHSLKAFVEALKVIDNHLIVCEDDDDLYFDEDAMSEVASKAGEIAGGEEYRWFYQMIFGI